MRSNPAEKGIASPCKAISVEGKAGCLVSENRALSSHSTAERSPDQSDFESDRRIVLWFKTEFIHNHFPQHLHLHPNQIFQCLLYRRHSYETALLPAHNTVVLYTGETTKRFSYISNGE